jgi:hypothetical protein
MLLVHSDIISLVQSIEGYLTISTSPLENQDFEDFGIFKIRGFEGCEGCQEVVSSQRHHFVSTLDPNYTAIGQNMNRSILGMSKY